MPYHRYNSRNAHSGRFGYRRYGYYRSNYSMIPWKRLIRKAYKLSRKALSNQNVEYKYIDSSDSDTTPTTAVTYHINQISQGDGPTNRDGAQVKMKKLVIRGGLSLHPSSPLPTKVRVILWRNVSNNSSSSTGVANVLDSSDVNSLRNLNETERIKVLSDKVYSLDQDTKSKIQFKIVRGFMKYGLVNSYNKSMTAGTLGATERNPLLLTFIADQDTAGSESSHDFTSRIRFIDN